MGNDKINICYNGEKNLIIDDQGETKTIQNNLIESWELGCSSAEEGKKTNFHIKNTSHQEILELKEHIEKIKNIKICDENENEYRIKIKVEYQARNIIKNIYQIHNGLNIEDHTEDDNTYENHPEQTDYIREEYTENSPEKPGIGSGILINGDDDNDDGFSVLKDLL